MTMHANKGWDMIGRNGARLLATVSLTALLAACAVQPEPFTTDQLNTKAAADRQAMFEKIDAVTGPITLPDAIARALKYNLDKRAKVMEEALAAGQTQVDKWDLLPKLTADAGYSGRDQPAASRSRDLISQTTSTSNPTYSADREGATADLGLSWNILDFGVSYFNAHQNADRVLIAAEHRRKTVHNLIQEVRYAYWRAAAAQALESRVQTTVAEAKDALGRARTVERENLKAPVESLRFQKSLLETMRQLTAIQQELSTAIFELSALINVPPGTKLVLDVPSEDKMAVPDWSMPIDTMEEAAFRDNPDLREHGYLARIAVDDTRKAIVKMLPGITFTASRNWDSDSLLVYRQWYEAGAKVTWNLFNVLSANSTLDYAHANEDVTQARRMALRMAVLAQVHVSERQFRNAVSQYQQADDLWQVDKRLVALSEAKTDNNAQGVLERVASEASAIASQLRRFQTYAQVEQAYAKMQATLGQDLLPEEVKTTDLQGLSAVVAERLNDWNMGSQAPEFQAKAVDVPAAPPVPEARPVAVPVAAEPEPQPVATPVAAEPDPPPVATPVAAEPAPLPVKTPIAAEPAPQTAALETSDAISDPLTAALRGKVGRLFAEGGTPVTPLPTPPVDALKSREVW